VRFDEALAEFNRAQELDPLTPVAGATVAWPLHYRGQYDAAAKQIEKMLEMYPKDKDLLNYLHLIRAESFLERGMERQAVEEYIQSDSFGGASPVAALNSAYETSGIKGYWQKSVDLEEDKYRKESDEARRAGGYMSSLQLAKLYARLADWDKTFAALETCFQNRDENLLFIRVESIRGASPRREIKSDPRSLSRLRRRGLEGWANQRLKPDYSAQDRKERRDKSRRGLRRGAWLLLLQPRRRQQRFALLAEILSRSFERIRPRAHDALPQLVIKALRIQLVFLVVIHVAQLLLPPGGSVAVAGGSENASTGRQRVFRRRFGQWQRRAAQQVRNDRLVIP